jgi:hypothetical protein
MPLRAFVLPVLLLLLVQPEPSVIVGVVRGGERGSAIEVVGRFSKDAWVNTWGSVQHGSPIPGLTDVPESWLGGPVPRDWTVWSRSGVARSATVTGTGPPFACEGPVMLPIDSAGDLQHFHYELAVSTAMPVTMIGAVPRAEQAWREAEVFVGELVPAHERAAIEERLRAPGGGRRVTHDALEGQPLILAYLVRPVGDTGVYYFETRRRSKVRDREGASVSGWLRHEAIGGFQAFGVTARVLAGSERSPIPHREPLAILRWTGHEYFVIRTNGYEGWSTGFFRMSPSGPLLVHESHGGGC